MTPLSRRGVLIGGVLAVATLPLVTGCTGNADPQPPDPLLALAAQARADVATAKAVAAAFPGLATTATLVGSCRSEHATALQQELDRAHPGGTSASAQPSADRGATVRVPADQASAVAALSTAMTGSEKQAAELVPTLPTHRAGLVGSVAASCACLRVVLS